MLTVCQKPILLGPNALSDLRLIVGPDGLPVRKYPILSSTAPVLLTAESAPIWVEEEVEVEYPSSIFPERAPKVEGVLVYGDEHSLGRPASITFDNTSLRDESRLFAGQVGQLQEQRQGLLKKASVIVRDLQAVEYWYSAVGEPVSSTDPTSPTPVTTGLGFTAIEGNVLSPSLHGSFPLTQFFYSVQDALLSFVCETSAKLRKKLTAVDRLLGCVDHVLFAIRRSVDSRIRLFCSVCWEKRRWFLLHGSRPPKATAQASLGLFAGACLASLLAF